MVSLTNAQIPNPMWTLIGPSHLQALCKYQHLSALNFENGSLYMFHVFIHPNIYEASFSHPLHFKIGFPITYLTSMT